MYVYHYHIFDQFAYPDVVSLAILADDDPNWRPNSFAYANVGSSLEFKFSTIKLLDFQESVLEQSDNPFALVVLAHLRALKTRGKPQLLMREKIALIRALRERRYHGEQVIHLYKVVDYMITLSERIEQLVDKIVREFEAESEWPLTSLEELAIKRGAAQGLEQGLEQGLQQGAPTGTSTRHCGDDYAYSAAALWRSRFELETKTSGNSISGTPPRAGGSSSREHLVGRV